MTDVTPPAADASPPTRMGRFELRRLLGESEHAAIWQAVDTRNQREVVLRLLRLRGDEDPNQVARWLARARNLVRLVHPHIVPVLEADLQGTQPYVVMAHVPGQSLARLLARRGAMPATEAVALACGLLEGLATAHASGVLHRNLQASNVLVDAEARGLLLDFALPPLQVDAAGTAPGSSGQPAPETVQGQPATAATDVFGIGLLLAEMLLGSPLLDPAHPEQARYRLVHEQLAVPEPSTGPLDPGLRGIVQKALARDPSQRHASAQELREALLRWPELPAEGADAQEDSAHAGNTVLQNLLRRMRNRSDFPAMSDAVVRIQALTSSESESIGSITNEILKDVALTNKLLRLVNSAHYARPGGDSIRTVSRAVSLIGLNGIRNLSLSLVLLEHMPDRSHADMLKEEFLRCLLAGAIGGELCLTAHEAEEAFIASMFQNLGRLLAGYYFPEEARTIRGLVASKGQTAMTEEAASASVLGLGFEDLGIGVARAWGLPESIQHSLRKPLGQPPAHVPAEPAERQRWTAFAANTVADLLLRAEPREVDARLEALAARHAKVLGLKPADALKAVADGRARFIDMVEALQLRVTPGSPAARMLLPPTQSAAAEAAGARAGDGLAALEMQAARPLQGDAPAQDSAARRTQILAAGIQDITQVMVEDHKLNDVLRMILETMLRALELRWIVFCLREPKSEALTGRFGLGQGVERVVRAFHVPVKPGTTDLMGAVCIRGLDTQISDASEGRIAERLPAWFHQQVQAPAFLLLPLQMQGRPFALIYGDMAQKNALRLEERELALLRTLRNQAVMAFKRG